MNSSAKLKELQHAGLILADAMAILIVMTKAMNYVSIVPKEKPFTASMSVTDSIIVEIRRTREIVQITHALQ